MADKTPAPIEGVDAAILTYLQAEYEGVALLAGWVIVAEFINTDGDPDITAFAADGLPYWRVNGLLDAAPYEMGYVGEDEELDD
jgi:hypothetical protein